MKIITAAALLCTGLAFASCTSVEEKNAKSVHVDSTNENGTAPVQYGAHNPADTTQSLQPTDDTGRRSNTEQR